MNNRKVACFFAGVGGIDLGFEQTGAFEVVYAMRLTNTLLPPTKTTLISEQTAVILTQ